MVQQVHSKVLSCLNIAPEVFIIELEKRYPFVAGQIIGITTTTNISPRLYSICSAPSEPTIKILFKVVNNGQLTPQLAGLIPGNTVMVTQPHGKFVFDGNPAWWIAAGTGIAPFASMYLSGHRPLKLIQGARSDTDFYLSHLFTDIPHYIKCVSQALAVADAGFYAGRLTRYIGALNEFPPNINYYICGSAEMVVDVRSILIAKGVGFNRIITEIYF